MPEDSAPRPARVGARLARRSAGLAAAAAMVAGCATMPSTGIVQATPTPSARGLGGAQCCGLIVRGPQPGWNQQDIVRNFLLASASFAQDHKIARMYLTPAASRNWRPGSAVTIVKSEPVVHLVSQRPAAPAYVAAVTVTGQQVATLNPNGQYIPGAPGGTAQQQEFGLEKINGQWRISSLPSGPGPAKVSHELLLTQSLFDLVYQARNLYFYARRDHALVPDPVFVPADSPNLVQSLINDLSSDPRGWLDGAAVTAFPRGARLKGVQVLPGPGRTAIVDLAVPGSASQADKQAIAEQLAWTLTSNAYSQPLFQSVKLKINGDSWPPGRGRSLQSLADYGQNIPGWGKNPAVYFVSDNGAVRVLERLAARSVPVPGEAGTGRLPLDEIAVSPDGRRLAGISGPAATLYTADLSPAKQESAPAAGVVRERLSGASLSTPAWDSAGDLWVARRAGRSWELWVLPDGRGTPVRVDLPAGLEPVRALRIAPDGVRIAMIVGKGADTRLVMAAIVRAGGGFALPQTVPLGPGLADVVALTWYDEDHLLAVTRSGSGEQLCQVPVNGDGASCRAAPAGTESITAAGAQNPLYVGLDTGQLEKSVGLAEPWTDAGSGRDPAYPG